MGPLRPTGFLLLLVAPLLLPLATAAAGPAKPLLRQPEDAWHMTWAQLDEVFRDGTIHGGIPSGYTYGFCVVNPAYPGWQTLADKYWHGKHFEVLFEADPSEDCTASAAAGIKGCGGPRGVVTNYLSLLPRDQRVYYQEMPGLVVSCVIAIGSTACNRKGKRPPDVAIHHSQTVHWPPEGHQPAPGEDPTRRQAEHHCGLPQQRWRRAAPGQRRAGHLPRARHGLVREGGASI